ncbi:hypothetical protein BCR41DRAFT_359117 [Lobosporangium transversale]|uniref:Uncharacterized protein n=1 Tax=Lobosporangium transversale TaxID=64571 RepID=A0A1Y2GH03_9FUNG|nr:hypothetical protein BCR41DRAFT_359117 [Lobosporangium transversale]ORZ08838.1 hypothetical protein BCR41DRAFT_359117 [Lobosporangium transversale]|eukprot:XP_021878621.1 hypothetical protein BCR41DRAFT_359117 [Lobosporangium transversale]
MVTVRRNAVIVTALHLNIIIQLRNIALTMTSIIVIHGLRCCMVIDQTDTCSRIGVVRRISML